MIVHANPDRTGDRLDAWATDEDLWLRRSALLALLDPLRTGGDLARFERYATAMLDETEPFIRKAIGWILRDIGRKRPERTRAFVERHLARMSGVTFREALEVLDDDEAADWKARHKAARKLNKGSTKQRH